MQPAGQAAHSFLGGGVGFGKRLPCRVQIFVFIPPELLSLLLPSHLALGKLPDAFGLSILPNPVPGSYCSLIDIDQYYV